VIPKVRLLVVVDNDDLVPERCEVWSSLESQSKPLFLNQSRRKTYCPGEDHELVSSLVNVVSEYLCQTARACYRYSHHEVLHGGMEVLAMGESARRQMILSY
jgi:hypothetical protein